MEFLEPLINCHQNAIYQNGRCYVPYTLKEPLPLFDAQTGCRREFIFKNHEFQGGQLAFSVGETAQNEIIASIRKQNSNNNGSCFWMGESDRSSNESQCKCFYVTNANAIWSNTNCDSLQQWVCEFAPESSTPRPIECYSKPTEQAVVFNGQFCTEW
ncbi:unnamed protein product [Gongylonema pulchrum]|uniref:C-type lectin domain-containing protein n=1 Tax=Gongylonema pulchrum TaxID=637853 RepID=A0A3P6P7U9_9BILA|nr:unnamed protein product [Gongylonema pulchrum]